MAQRKLPLASLFTCTLALFPVAGLTRHVHAGRKHMHHVRQVAPANVTSLSATPSITAGNALTSDIQEIEQGLGALPQDLLAFITAVDDRLQQVEAALASLLGSPSPQVTPAPTASLDISYTDGLSSSSATTTDYTTPTGVQPPSSALHTTRTTTETITWTTHYTVTHHLPIPTGSLFNYTNNTMYGFGTAVTAATAALTISQAIASPSQSAAYTFRADSSANVAVYYGQTPNTTADGLLTLCQRPSVDIIILAFVNDFFTRGGYPSVNFGPACDPPNSAQVDTAPGLLDCPRLGAEIAECQDIGKKVLVSLGGYLANTTFTSEFQAVQSAETLWDLFGAGTPEEEALRPFGTGVVVDGFDIDTEQKNPAHYETFARALRDQFQQDTTKKYYLSAAPQCPMPDASIPLNVMKEADFVWVQFYNNPACNINSTGFQQSFADWSRNLTNTQKPGTPRLYIGAPAFAGAGSGYVEGAELETLVSQARELNVRNLGGIMLWDGTEGMENVDQYGDNYLFYAKSALQ